MTKRRSIALRVTTLLGLLILSTLPAAAQQGSRGAFAGPFADPFVEGRTSGGDVLYRLDRPGAALHVTSEGLRLHLERGTGGHTLLWRLRRSAPLRPLGLSHADAAPVGILDRTGYRRLATFAELCSDDLLPGVDLHLGVDRAGDPKYEFRLDAGIDPSTIVIDYVGADALSVEPDGRLRIATSVGPVHEAPPVAWQQRGAERVPLAVRFELTDDGGVRFRVGRIDPALPTIIDPAIRFSTYLGGNGNDVGRGVATDASGDVFVTGYSHSADFPITPGAWDRTRDTVGGTADIFVSRLDRTGRNLLWSTWISGLGHDDPLAGIRATRDGGLLIGGITSSADFPRTAGVIGPDSVRGVDGFMLKLDTNGRRLIFSTLLGGSGGDTLVSFDLDIQRNIVVAGHSSSTDLRFPAGSYQTTNAGRSDIFALRLNQTATVLLNGSWVGGPGEDRATDIVVGAGGESYISGTTRTDTFPTTPNAIAATPLGGRDGVVLSLRFDFTELSWSTRLGGSGDDRPESIARDSSGRVLVTGRTGSTDYPDNVGLAAGGSWFVTLFRVDRTIDYSLLLSSDTLSGGLWAGFDPVGRPLLAGSTSSPTFPSTANPKRVGPRGGEDVALIRLAANGRSLERVAVIGGSLADRPASHLTSLIGDELLVTGLTGSSNFPLSRYPWDSLLNVERGINATDAFVLTWSFDEAPNIVGPRLFPVDTLRCETSVQDTFYVHNDGERPATIYASLLRTSDGPFTLVEPPDISAIVVAPGDSVRYVVAYRNEGVGTSANDVLVYSTDSLGGRTPLVVPIVGVRSAPSIAAQPTTLAFGSVATCDADTLDLQLRNNGRGRVSVRTPTFLSGSGGYRVAPGTTFPLSIPQGEIRTVRIVFDPTQSIPYTDVARFTIIECPFSVLEVGLSGRGEEAEIVGIPDTVDFGPLPACVLSADSSFVIRNSGSVPLEIRTEGADPVDFDLSGTTFPRTIPPADSVVIDLLFRPTVSGPRADSITFRIGPCDSLITLYLRGEQRDEGLPRALRNRIEYGPVIACAGTPVSIDSLLRVVNPGTETVILSAPQLTGPFELCGLTTPTEIDPGGTVGFHICYRPTAEGDHDGEFTVEFRSGECRDTIRVALNGRLEEPRLTAPQAEIDIGLLEACETRAEVEIPLENDSGGEVTIESIAAHPDLDLSGLTLPITITSGASHTLTVAVDLQQSGPFAIPVRLTIGPCDQEVTVTIRGETSGVVVDVDRDTMMIGPTLVCTPPNAISDSVRISWTGTSADPVTITSVRLLDGSGELLIEDVGSLIGREVPTGGALPIGVSFAPSATGIVRDTLEVVLAPCNDTIRIPVTAAGVLPTLSVSSGAFGQVLVTTTLTRSIAIGNTSGLPLVIDLSSLPTGPWSVDTVGLNLPRVLEPDGVIFLPVTFSPLLRGIAVDSIGVTLSGGCEYMRTIRLDGEGIDPVVSGELCIRGLYLEPGRAGDTVEVSIGVDRPRTLPSPVDLELTVRFDPKRIDPVDAIDGDLVDVDLATGRATIEVFGVQNLPDDLPSIRLRLLGGDALFTLVGLDSVALIGGGSLSARLCDTNAVVTITNRCIVSGVTLGAFAGKIEPISPNPAGNRIRLTFQQLEDAPTSVTILDATGREVLRPIDGPMRGGRYTIEVDVADLPAGLYVVAITAGSWHGSTFFLRHE